MLAVRWRKGRAREGEARRELARRGERAGRPKGAPSGAKGGAASGGAPHREVAAYALRQAGRRLVAPLARLFIHAGRVPTRLVLAPQDIRVSDPTVAADIYAGHFAFAGRIANAHGRSPFDIVPPGDLWAAELHGFAWLRHLRAADTALARANARALVGDWMEAKRHRGTAAWRPAVVARRLLSWLSHSPLILEGADERFYRRLIRSMVAQATFLQRQLAGPLEGTDRLWAAMAVAALALCVDRPAPARRATAPFLAELDQQVLGDGGHISRDPQVIADLLLDLLPLRQAYASQGAVVPPSLLNAIDRMMPMLRLFRHGDGPLALFNGMGVTQPEVLATILAYDDLRAMPLSNAALTGYQRLTAGASVLVMDAGTPPPLGFSGRAHAGALSFEFSSSGQPLIVNCGHPAGEDGAMAAASRTTAAHSTLVLGDTPSARLVRHPRLGLAGLLLPGPRHVVVSRDQDTTLEVSHDGYAALGYLHKRRITLGPEGGGLWGEDALRPIQPVGGAVPPERSVELRFHLHPAVRAFYHEDGRSVVLATPDGALWCFEAGVQAVSVEESIYFGSPEGPRRTEQMVVRTTSLAPVAWSLTAFAPA